MKHLTELLTYRALHFKLHTASGDPALLDIVAEDEDYASKLQLKNVCAKLTPELSDEIDEIVGLLSISKRRFLEAAFVDAVQQAHQIMANEGVWESMGREAPPEPRLIHLGDK